MERGEEEPAAGSSQWGDYEEKEVEVTEEGEGPTRQTEP